MKLKIKVCIQKLTEQEAFIRGKRESEFNQLKFQIEQLTHQLEAVTTQKDLVQNAYDYMWQNHADKVDASK